MDVMRDTTLDDDEKEKKVQSAALSLFSQFFWITLTAVLVLAASGVVMWLGDLTGVASFDAVMAFLLSWEIIVGTTVLLMAIFWFLGRRA